MTGRPYLNMSAQELEASARETWDSIPGLQAILGELRHRTTAKAQRLEREVTARVATLGGDVTAGASDAPRGRGSGTRGSSKGEGASDSTDGTVHELTMRAVRAEQQVRELSERLRAAQAEIARAQDGGESEIDQLYATVGLHVSCPDFLVKAAWRTYRKEFHPDALSDRPKEEQLAAQERFKEFEQVFNRIQASRG